MTPEVGERAVELPGAKAPGLFDGLVVRVDQGVPAEIPASARAIIAKVTPKN